MTNTYLNQLLNEFDQEFESLIIPFPSALVVNKPVEHVDDFTINSENINDVETVDSDNSATQKLNLIKNLAVEISAERYKHNYNPEVCLANLLNYILADDNQNLQNDFFQLLDQEHNVDLEQALNDFDFYLNNPYKKKAEKILSKIEARKNK